MPHNDILAKLKDAIRFVSDNIQNYVSNPGDFSRKPAGAKVTFKSSDTSIVKVGKDGQIKGVKAGKATITVSGDGVEFKIKVTVKK